MQIQVRPEDGRFVLWIVDANCSLPAGHRLFRGDPPQVRFVHDNEQEAKADAAKLEAYIEAYRLKATKRKA